LHSRYHHKKQQHKQQQQHDQQTANSKQQTAKSTSTSTNDMQLKIMTDKSNRLEPVLVKSMHALVIVNIPQLDSFIFTSGHSKPIPWPNHTS
jgi:hypothetical protein